MFIPTVSQTKLVLKDAIVFPCKHCGKKLWKPEELAGTEIICHECDKENTVPEKTAIPSREKTPIKLHDSFITHEATITNLIIVGRPPVDPDAPPEEKLKSQIIYNTAQSKDTKKEENSSASLSRDAYLGPLIIITEDPPTIQKIKNYFQRKAEKYFIFALFVLFIEYLINTYGEKRRPSKTFIIFSTFAIAAIILMFTWNHITYTPPSQTSKCRYNVICTNPKCNLNEIRKFEDVTKGKCSKCSSHIGLAYRCKACNKSFVYDEVKSKKEHKGKIIREANKKTKWTGKKVKTDNTLFNSRIVKKCPYCRSEDVYYVTVKQAEKEAEQATIEKKLQEMDKKNAKKK